MSEISSRMQLRAQILRLLNKYRGNKNPSNLQISQDSEFLKETRDKQYVAKLLFKELSSSESEEYINVCAILALEVIDKNTFENCAIKLLQNKEIPDEKKFLIISLIKQRGIYFDYEEIENYIKNPESVAQNSVKDFLANALYDPEVQIDLIDFYVNIPKNERIYLLSNLSEEEDEDSIACAMSILAQLDNSAEEFKIIKNILLKLGSPFALEGLSYILKNCKLNLKERQKFKNKQEELLKSNPEFKNDLIIKNSQINDCYISFIDGNSSFSLILSRKMDDNSIDALLLTIDTRQGITACMGFGNITQSNYETIIKRLFNDLKPAKISPMAFKALYEHYKNKNKRTNTPLPYELIVWKCLISDIDDINYDISQFLNYKLDTVNLEKDAVREFLTSRVVHTWYWTHGQNEAIDKIINIIEKKHIKDYKEINELVKTAIENDFINNQEFLTEIQDRLLLSAYIAHLAGLKMSSRIAYSLCFKNPYSKMLIEYLIDRSLYEYFADIYEENLKQSANSVFKRGKKSKFVIEELDTLMASIEEKWE